MRRVLGAAGASSDCKGAGGRCKRVIHMLAAVCHFSSLIAALSCAALILLTLGSAGFVCAGGAARPLAEAACAACRGSLAGFFPDLGNAGTLAPIPPAWSGGDAAEQGIAP